MSGLDCCGVENALDRPSITTDCEVNVSDGEESKELWDWNKCASRILHVEDWVACRTFNCTGIDHPGMVE